MLRPLITIVILCLTAAVGIRADAGGGGGLKVGQVKLSAPIAVTLTPGDKDVFDDILPLDHPAYNNGINFSPVLKDIVFSDQTVQVQDFVLLNNQWNGSCEEVRGALLPVTRIIAKRMESDLIKPIVTDPHTKDTVPQACTTFMKDSAAIDALQGTLSQDDPGWCAMYFEMNTSGWTVDGGFHSLCDTVTSFEQAFGNATFGDLGDVCDAFQGCLNISNGCVAMAAPCQQLFVNAFMTPGGCAQNLTQQSAHFCNSLQSQYQGQCVDGLGALCPAGTAPAVCDARQAVCVNLKKVALGATTCITENFNALVCYAWQPKFTTYCDGMQIIAGMEEYWSSESGEFCNNGPWSTPQDEQTQAFKDFCALPEEMMCKGDNFFECSKAKAECALLLETMLPLSRVMVGDVRAQGPQNVVNDTAEVLFSGQRVLPYSATPTSASFPQSLFAMPRGAVIGGAGWADGVVTILRDPRPFVNMGDLSDPQNPQAGSIIETFNEFGYPAVAYFRLHGDGQGGVPLQLHSISPGFWGADSSFMPGQDCFLLSKNAVDYKNAGCVSEKVPIGVAALNLFQHPESHARDLVVINQGPVPFEEKQPIDPAAYVTVYRWKDPQPNANANGYSSGAEWTDIWTYQKYYRLHGMKPMEHCEQNNRTYITLNQKGKDKNNNPAMIVDEVLVDALGQVQVVPHALTTPANIGKIDGFGPYGIACGDFDQDTVGDIAVTWAELSTDGELVNFQNVVSVYKGLPGGGFSATPLTSLMPLPVKQDTEAFPTAWNAEYATVTRCNLDGNLIDDLCVGDQREYLIDGNRHVYMWYFPFTKVGLVNADLIQQHKVNIAGGPVSKSGLGGVNRIVTDQYNNIGLILEPPHFFPPTIDIVCEDRDGDKIWDKGQKYIKDGVEILYPKIVDPEIKALIDDACNIDNCPGIAPSGFVMPVACDGSEKSKPDDHICYNSSQADWDKDGFGNVCDPDIEPPKFDFKKLPENIGPKLPPGAFEQPKAKPLPGGL